MAKIELYTGKITTGTIVFGVKWGEEKSPAIIISNACDIENDKAGYVMLAGLVRAKDTLKDSKEYKNIYTEGNELKTNTKKSLVKFFQKYIYNTGIARYYLIYPGDDVKESMPAMLVDFQRIQSIPYEELSSLIPIGEIRSPFREEMIYHFTSYTGRVPVDREKLDNILPMVTDLEL